MTVRLRITAAGVGLTLEAPAAADLAAMYAMLLGQPDKLKELLAVLIDDDDDDDDETDDDTQGGPDPDGDGGMTADVDKLLAQAGISTD